MDNDKIWVILAITLICLSVLCVAVNTPDGVPDNVVSLMEKAFLGLFGLASGTGIGFALGKKKPSNPEEKKGS